MPGLRDDGPLDRQQIDDLRKRLARMSMTALSDFYYAAWTMCKPESHSLPRATCLQQLVQAWKEMRKRSQRP